MSQLPEEVFLAIRKLSELHRSWQQIRDPAVNAQPVLVKWLLATTAGRWVLYLKSLEVRPESVWQAASRLIGEESTRHPLQSSNGLCTLQRASLRSLPTPWRSSFLFIEVPMTQTTRPLVQTSFLDIFPSSTRLHWSVRPGRCEIGHSSTSDVTVSRLLL